MTKIEIYTSSATGMLKVKKDQQSLKFLLDKKKVNYLGDLSFQSSFTHET